jgi:DNA-binding beta-propeller fold protein YncE
MTVRSISTAVRAALGMALAAGLFLAATDTTAGQAAGNARFELWVADQSDTRAGYGGQLLIFNGADLMGKDAASAQPAARIDLGAETSALCHSATGRNPVRPHMVLFNRLYTHAVVSFVASGHVVIFDAAARKPLQCFETTVSATTKTRQAHAAFPAPDGTYILVANQNGKQLERIDTNFASNTFTHNTKATLDLATCTTPSGQPCEQADLRPVNWPICPTIDPTSRYAFVTLRGGGLFVVDARATPMAIVGEYDKATVKGNGCGGVAVGSAMYVNSGGSPVDVSSKDQHHPALYGFDVYKFPLSGYSAANKPNTPAPAVLLSKTGASDSHGMAPTGGGRYVWVMDRHADVAEILDLSSGSRVNTVPLNGTLTPNAAPDLVDVAPTGDRLFVALRGPVPLSGDPHNAVGSTPGVGIIQVTEGGRAGTLLSILPVTNPTQQENQQPDPHGLRVRLVR